MKLNKYPYKLLAIFEEELKSDRTFNFRHYREVNLKEHVFLKQDRWIDYYAWATLDLFIYKPRQLDSTEEQQWQTVETYRLVNTALASSSDTLKPIHKKLLVLKKMLEENDYLKELLKKIDQGEIQADLVCSGHGTWYMSDGMLDLSQSKPGTSVRFFGGMGAELSSQLGHKIENEAYTMDELVIEHTETKKQTIDTNFPRLFSSTEPAKIPDFSLIKSKSSLPDPRVLEPKTGRVLYDLSTGSHKGNFFNLSTVLERFPGRVVNWAACMGCRDDSENKSGPYLGYVATTKDSDKFLTTDETLDGSSIKKQRSNPEHEDEETFFSYPHIKPGK